MKKVTLSETEWPDFGLGKRPQNISLLEFQARLCSIKNEMKVRGYSHLLIYGDREHFANLTWIYVTCPR